uniref:Acetylcholine receptor subunit beta-like 2 n=1 Tax=Aceria tosichella TaxID=561515 RepID=A0A6G1SMP0_9ACAR
MANIVAVAFKTRLPASLKLLVAIVLVLRVVPSIANPDANRLYEDLMMPYNRLLRPVQNDNDTLLVKLGLKLSQLIDVNLRYQMMTTIVWMEQEWIDYKLKWDPDDYGGITKLHVPSEDLWRPDLVLYNNADGDYVVTIMNKATLHNDGRIVWKPPAVYKSSCHIDVAYFPFDSQTCIMKFGTWTWNGIHIDLRHINQADVNSTALNSSSNQIDVGIDLSDFLLNVEWDVMAVPATRRERSYECCIGAFQDITFNVTLRRKTLFYTTNLILPCVVMSLLSILVFYLPSDSNEKISLTISIVLSVDVFLLCLIEIIPPTSFVVPLLGQYLLFTLTLVTVSVVATVYVLNISFRNASSHKMSRFERWLYLDILPRVLLMKRRDDEKCEEVCKTKLVHCGSNRADECTCDRSARRRGRAIDDYKEQTISLCQIDHHEIKNAFLSLDFVAKRMENRENHNKIEEDWRYAATVMDRLLLIVFSSICILGQAVIILQAPALYDNQEPIDLKLSKLGPKVRPNLPDSFDESPELSRSL